MVLLLNKNWMDVLEERAERSYGALTGEEKHLIWLQAWTAVQEGKACWFDRWQAVTYGPGHDQGHGLDERFVEGKLSGPKIKRPKDPEAVARERARKR